MKQNFKVPIAGYGITLTEIPGEIALYFEVGNCECHCKGCHSNYLWDTNLSTPMKNPEYIFNIVRKYKDDVTAILFMGGNRNGMDFLTFLEEVVKPATYCRWIKVGLYQKDKGGLDSPITNQLFLEVQNYNFLKGKEDK